MRRIVHLIILAALLFACANPVAPAGGPRDTEAPQVLLALPASGSGNFQGDQIELIFNEYINFQGSSEKVLVTPAMETQPKFVLKGKKLIIKLPENLDTTLSYSISLISAVSDFTEGNELNIYKYVFTRGANIDSASLSGVVESSFDKQMLANVFVGLFEQSDTGAFLTTKPIYISPTNEQGQFKLDYVRPGTYVVAALEDKNFDFKLDPQNERISLSSNPIRVEQGSVLEQNVPLFLTKQKPQIEEYKILSSNSMYISFNQEIEQIAIDIEQYSENDKVFFNKDNDTLFYYWSTPGLEQLDLVVNLNDGHVDSINVPLRSTKETEEKVEIKNAVSRSKPIVARMNNYIDGFNTDLITLLDSTNQALAYTVSTSQNKLLIRPSGAYLGEANLRIDSLAISYIDGSTNKKAHVKSISIHDGGTLSVLSLSFARRINENAVLELYNSNDKRIRVQNISGLLKLDLADLGAGKYSIRIYQDINANGKWDTGDVNLNQEAEKTLLYTPNVEIKENWDKELRLNF